MTKHLRRSGAALATAFACLALMANPASASTHDATITAGSITIVRTDTSTETLPLGSSTTGGCGSYLLMEHGFTPHVGHIYSTGFHSGQTFFITTSLNGYVGEISLISATTGSYSGTAISGVGMTLRMDVYARSSTTGCSHGTTRSCRYSNIGLTFSGTYNGPGDPWNPQVGDTATLSSNTTTLAVSPPCISLFTSFAGGTISISGLTFTYTS